CGSIAATRTTPLCSRRRSRARASRWRACGQSPRRSRTCSSRASARAVGVCPPRREDRELHAQGEPAGIEGDIMKQAILLAAALMVIAAPSRVGAQTAVQPPALQLTLEEAISAGLRTSHRLAELAARGSAAEAATAERHAATRPQIAAEAGYTRTNHVETFGIALPNNQLKIIYPDV